MDEINFTPIGVFKTNTKNPVEAPRQGSLNKGEKGEVLLSSNLSEQALRDLDGFSHLWLIYHFHKNNDWNELVRPPRGEKKRGVFATRSPYRPNGIGMSCVKLLEVSKNKILVEDHDLLDGTPILDIKPYLNYSDSFPEAELGWINDCVQYEVTIEGKVTEEVQWLNKNLEVNLNNILINQLSYEPTNSKIKRVAQNSDFYEFSYRTWRFYFRIQDHRISIFEINSGYSNEQLDQGYDPYLDKNIHKEYLKKFK